MERRRDSRVKLPQIAAFGSSVLHRDGLAHTNANSIIFDRDRLQQEQFMDYTIPKKIIKPKAYDRIFDDKVQ